jgi:outer membrane receptor protein involved in Fe transport
VNLQPEKADTYTLGVVLQPRWVPGLALTVDYFDIKVESLISTFGFQNVMNACGAGDLAFCALIHRDAAGSLWLDPSGNIELRNVNVGGLRTKGIDVNGSYSRRIGGMGTLHLSLVGTWLKDLKVNPFGDIEYDCAGFFGATCTNGAPLTAPNPKWRHKFRAGFTLPNGLGISGQWRYFSSVKADLLSNNPALEGQANPPDRKLNSKSYFDLALTARLADRYNFRLGANNLFDTDPPVASGRGIGPPTGNGNTYPQTYDALGRYLFAGVTIDF